MIWFLFTEHNLLLCLSDNLLVVHDINIINFPIVQTLPLTKGATLFTLDTKVIKNILPNIRFQFGSNLKDKY